MKTFYIYLIAIFFSGIIHAQTTAIPDPYFEQALIDKEIDSDGMINGQVFTTDIVNVKELYLNEVHYIEDLTGIEGFASLEKLYCEDNMLEFLDVSQNTNLKELYCGNSDAGFYTNGIASLDLSQNTALTTLVATNPPPATINLKNGNNQILVNFRTRCAIEGADCYPSLCVEVDDPVAANNSTGPYFYWSYMSSSTTFTDECALGVPSEEKSTFTCYVNRQTETLHLTGNIQQLEKLQLFDLSGKKVKTVKSDFQNITIGDLSSGIYFVKGNGKKVLFTQKIIK